MTKDLKGDRWTCPNDRNLQLRSKLNSGWSIHTGKKTIKKDPQLTEAELIEIQKVLQRSEMVERNERDRVLKLVDRLENMKRNANQAGTAISPNRCALCGDYFCLIRTAPTQCSSCNRILCNRCCVDTECTVDNDISSNPSQSRRNSSSSLSMTNSFISSSSSNAKVVVYLCRICSEQREFLKKSGAWFLKKFPNYLTDGTNSTKFSSTSNVSQLEKSNTSPAQLKQNSFVSPLMLKRNISSSSSNSSSFRFWKFKENTPNYAINNDVPDNVSDFSIDNERTDLNSNGDSNSNSVPTTSRDNLISNLSNGKTPTSPLKKQDIFQFNTNQNSPVTTPSVNVNPVLNNLSINTQSSKSPKNNINNNSNTDIVYDKKYSNKPLLNKTQSNNSAAIKLKDSNFPSDDDPSSPNMSSYKYYSNIINNLSPSSLAKNDTNTDSTLTNNFNDEKSPVNYKKNNVNCKNGIRIKKNSVSSITDEILNSSLSVSASNLNLDSNISIDSNLKKKCETTKLPRKNRNTEWCCTQLSIDDDKNEKVFGKTSFNTFKTKQLASSCTENTGSSLSINGIKPKLSTQTVNTLAKKIYNQNSSAIIGSLAGNGSTGVQSVSSLTSSLAKLDFK
ncbi:unnamed protein product [Brachionus calyciflorus]|uniref:RabBD domain-containing protein n=1 Tax=Brachionus calyciflorus TaxID=104777 RepID=A0A813NAN0_9BILA|nr:unnamed protein product [Brachionus calyciflorus]